MSKLDLNKISVDEASTEIARARMWMLRLAAAGFEVTSTWIENIEAQQGGDPNPRDAAVEKRYAWAHACLEQVAGAGIFWMLAPTTDPGRGAYAELGCAKTLRKVCFGSGDTVQSIYGALGLEFADDMNAFTAIVNLRARRSMELLNERGGYVVEHSL